VLKQTPIGTLGVWAYYHSAPPIARVVAKSPELAASVRFALIPISLVALSLILAPLFALAIVLWRVLRRRTAMAVVAVSCALFFAQPARAYQSSRPKSRLQDFGLAFSFKGGPYLPAIANQTLKGDPGEQTSFSSTFAEERDADRNPTRGADENALYTLGMDIQLFRSFGTAGIGGSFGFMQFIGRGVFPGKDDVSFDTTVFNLMPLSLTAFYRFDWLSDRIAIPFVPYVRGGLAYDIWWITNGRGHVSRWQGADKTTSSDDVVGRGGKLGFTGTLGMSILLNIFEPDASKSLFETTSIRGTYFFAEWQVDQVQGIPKKGFDLSDSTWNLGLYLEL
jgi:hypothetical protein